MLRFSALLRLLLWLALLIYFVFGALILGIRYWVLPHIDEWRPFIAKELSRALDGDVRFGAVRAEWRGPDLVLELDDVALTDERHRALLDLPQFRAIIALPSLLERTVRFRSVQATGMDLTLRRDQERRVWAAGQGLDAPTAADASEPDTGVLAWLAEQPALELREATLRWVDDTRTSEPLVLDDVNLLARNRAGRHEFSMSARPPRHLGAVLELRGAFTDIDRPDGRLYARFGNMVPSGWRPWLPVPFDLQSGALTARLWVDVQDGRYQRVVAQASAQDVVWSSGGELDVQARSLDLYFSGDREDFEVWRGREKPAPGQSGKVPFWFEAGGLRAHHARLGSGSVALDELKVHGVMQMGEEGRIACELPGVYLRNADVDLRARGGWRQGGESIAGILDLEAQIARASVAALGRYMPTDVDAEARHWMKNSLIGGEIRDGRMVLKGDLRYFPFADEPDRGVFRVIGSYTDGVIDYLPEEKESRGWPRLTDMQGRVEVHGSDLRIVADTASMAPTPQTSIVLTDVVARIPDLEHTSILTVEGSSRADASAYLQLIRHSPLHELLGRAFDEMQAHGNWEVPVHIRIPLANIDETKVRGAVLFGGGPMVPRAGFPEFRQVTGRLDFTDLGVRIPGVRAQWLGGTVSATGGLGGGQKGIGLQGTVDAHALQSLVKLPGMKRIQGRPAYSAVVDRTKSGIYTVRLQSDLQGLELDFPEPLDKPAAASWPLKLEWAPIDKETMALRTQVRDSIVVDLRHSLREGVAPFFSAGTVGVAQGPHLLASGLNIDLRLPRFDVDRWNDVAREFSHPGDEEPAAVLPDVRMFRVQAPVLNFLGATLDEATLTAQEIASRNWRLDISSSQTAGTAFWQEKHGRVAGHVRAKFDRLEFGFGNETESAPREPLSSERLNIPGVDLEVRKLTAQGRDLGSLSVQGVNEAQGSDWALERLLLSAPGLSLTGSGSWRLEGPERGLNLDARAEVEDLGAYLAHLGFDQIVRGGEGTINGRIRWHNLPWTFDRTDIEGKLEIDLLKGRFNTLQSRSGRLLELLSLQSVKRLARMDPAGFLKEGFAFDHLRGTIDLGQGHARTENYRVVGPVGTIVIGGEMDLRDERLDLQAVVVPNLDVSGAAIAAGIAINPLVGIGAFLTQLFLQAPLSKAMTVQYRIQGTLDDPSLEEVAPARRDQAQ